MLDGALELLAPTRCAGCDRPGSLLCEACRDSLPLIDARHACPRCGAPDGRGPCEECGDAPSFVAHVRCVGLLEAPLSRVLTVYKDAGERRLALLLGDMVAELLAEWADWAEALVPIPATVTAVSRRGFDHARLIADAVSRASGIPVVQALVCAAGRDQRGLGRTERRANVGSAFGVREGVRPPAHVLLLDDVLTTGATLDSAARTLLDAGAEEIRAMTVARAIRPESSR